MTLTDRKVDPLVEILRLAYRRGLAIQREQEEKSKEINSRSLQDDTPNQKSSPPVEVAKLGQEESTEQH